MINRGQNFEQVPIRIAGSSTFGRYPKINNERTINMFVSDSFLIPYAGYEIEIPASRFNNGIVGRGCFSSVKLNKLVIVIDRNVYLVDISFNQQTDKPLSFNVTEIGQLQTSTGIVYIAENNKPQIAISDGVSIYIYDPNPPGGVSTFSIATKDGTHPISFTPGYITFHDTYLLCAASNDTYSGSTINNSWRLSLSNNGLQWPDDSSHVGSLQSKPDNTQAVVRFPSKGNMILVMGSTVTEAWFDTGAQLFPYQRNNQFNIDYGCLSPATVAYMDELVVWLAYNEKSGPIVMYSTGGMPQKITTDGIDYLFAQMSDPSDSQAFLYRQDGHLFYHINFYTDNLSLFFDFRPDGTIKIYNACDEHYNYFIVSQVAFFNNQYYFVTRNNGNMFALDTTFETYQNVDSKGTSYTTSIPRVRITNNIRNQSQEYRIVNDVGFTIESGETNYQPQPGGDIYLITQAGDNIITQDGSYLVIQQEGVLNITPRVDMAVSYDGGASFGNEVSYVMNPIGLRKNKLMWWQLGAANDMVLQFKFWGMGRFVATDGVANLRR